MVDSIVPAALGRLGLPAAEIIEILTGLGISPGALDTVEFSPGRGRVALELALKGRMRVYGLCDSLSSSEGATKLARRLGVADLCHFEAGCPFEHPFPDTSFDLAVFSLSRSVLGLPARFGPDLLEELVGRWMTRLRPGGHLILDAPFAADSTVNLNRAVGLERAAEATPGTLPPPPHLSHTELVEILRADGRELVFEYIRPRDLTLGTHFQIRHWLDAMEANGRIAPPKAALIRDLALILDDSLMNGVWAIRQLS